MKLVFATGNPNKVREINDILPEDVVVVSLADIGFHDEIPETSETIEGNSMQKARYLRDVLGRDGFAEDTGLEVDALNGDPGIYSARFAGPQKDANDNMDLLLERLRGVEDRKARFRTVITLLSNGEEHQFEGVLEGSIGLEKRGSNGFGYDPVFVLSDGRSLAEIDPEEKAAISHRAKAVEQLMKFLQINYI